MKLPFSGMVGRNRPLLRLGKYVIPSEVGYEIDGARDIPNLIAKFEIRDGRPQCVDVMITAKPDGRSITTSDLRSIDVDELMPKVFASQAMNTSTDLETGVTVRSPVVADRDFWAALNGLVKTVNSPRRGSTRAELAQVAEIYKENPDAPVKAVLATLNYPSERTALRRVQEARRLGLLPPTGRTGRKKS